MKKIISLMTAIIVMLSAISLNAFAADNGFSDIDGHWAEETIIKYKEKNIVAGYPDGTFRPDGSITRAEFSKIITEAFGLREKTTINYDDVSSESWYHPYLECSAKYIPDYPLPVTYDANMPYINKYGKNLNYFLPETAAIRMHIAEALVEIKKDREKTDIELPVIQDVQKDLQLTFLDGDYENLYAMHGTIPTNVRRMFEYTWLAKELDVMLGNTEGYFMPYGYMTRAELLTALDRLL